MFTIKHLHIKTGEKCMIECLRKYYADNGKNIKEFHEKILKLVQFHFTF